MRRVVLFVALTLLYGSAMACMVPPKQTTLTKDELIESTNTIVLSELIGAIEEKPLTTFSFRVVEVLKGNKSGEFSLQLTQLPKEIRSTYEELDFDSHRDPAFFGSKSGRLPWLPGPCLPYYEFSEGKKYLLFLESLGNGASAEVISSPDDGWYQYVSEKLQETPNNSLKADVPDGPRP